MTTLRVRTGGQTGVDRAALDYAIDRGLSYDGWCPHGGWAEDFPEPPGLLPLYPRLLETPSTKPAQRTAWNVRDSHATLILLPAGLEACPGTRFTKQMAEWFRRPCWVADPIAPASIELASDWLNSQRTSGGAPFILNVAGVRESEFPGIYAITLQTLPALLSLWEADELFSRQLESRS